MRKILFRGKRVDNGEWTEGYFIERDTPEYHAYIVKSFEGEVTDKCTDILKFDIAEVVPETVGQYTGCTDDENNKIFEGDLIRNLEVYDDVSVVKYSDGEFALQWKDSYDDSLSEYSVCSLLLDLLKVGNIYDNPDLLKWLDEEKVQV